MKLKLLGKILLFTLLPIVLGVAGLTMVASTLATKGLSDVTDVQMLELAKKQASEMDNIMRNALVLAQTVAENSGVENFAAMANAQSSPEFSTLQQANNELLGGIVEKYEDISVALIIGKDGKSIAHANPKRIGLDLSAYPTFKTALGGQYAIGTQKSRQTGKMSALITTPIRSNASSGQVDAVLMLILDLTTMSKNTISGVKVLPSTNLFVVDSDCILLMDVKYNDLAGEDQNVYAYAKPMMSERTGITRYVWEGTDKVVHFAELPMTKWIVAISSNEEDFFEAANDITFALVIAGLLIVLAVALIVYFVVKKVVIAVSNSADIATYVAQGNLTLTAEQDTQLRSAVQRGDEISTLAQALNTMIQNLAKMVFESEEKSKEAQVAANKAEIASQEAEKSAQEADAKRESILRAVVQLEGIVNNIASASEQLSAQIDLSTNGAEEQSMRMTETATAMDEMNSTVLEVAKNSSTSAELADNTRGKAIEGAEITSKCQTSMTQVKDESLKLRQNMSELASHAQSINAIMSVISDIADQTNLLALNAAIEAARAGEAGRGFAVVADEVRKLAEKTISSTTDVANAINAIQQSTEVNVQQVDMAVTRIEEATELAVEGGQALQVILDMAEESADGIRAIATASEEQSATSDEIAQSIVTVSNIAESTVNAMNEAAQAVSSLSEQAQQLAALVENLKNS